MRSTGLVPILAACLAVAACTARKDGQIEIGFVSNASSDFWKIARAGVRDAEREFGVVVNIREPGEASPTQQKQIMEYLIGRNVKGLAISALSPESQIGMLDEAAEQVPLICMDSDAPGSKRLAYIGTDNVQAGRICGALLKEVLPNGGKVAAFVGKLDSANARDRIRGIREAIGGTGIEIAEIFTDEARRPVAQQNVRNAIAKYPDLACLLGIWSYNGPAIVQVVREAPRPIPAVCFDEEEGTLVGIEEGLVTSTVVQDPYQFGYLSIKVLAQLARGEKPEIPENGLIHTPIRVVMREAREALVLPDGGKVEVLAVAGFHEEVRRLIAERAR